MPERAFVFAAIVALVAPVPAAQTDSTTTLTSTSKEAVALYEAARDHLENVESARARPLIDEAIARDPGFAMAYLLRSRAGGGFTVTRQSLDKAVSLAATVTPAERHWIMAVRAQASGDLAGMKQHLDDLLKAAPNDKHAAYFAGTLYVQTGNDAKGLECFDRATAIDPAFAAPHNQAGYIQLRLGNDARAEAAFKKYIAARPESANPYDSYAEMLLRRGRYDESIVHYRNALAKDPAFALSFAGIGHAYVFKGEFARGRESYNRLADLDLPGARATALYWTALSYVHEARVEEALNAFEDAREAAADQGLVTSVLSIHFDEAWILSERGKVNEARTHLAELAKAGRNGELPESDRAYWRREFEFGSALVAARAKDRSTARSHMEQLKALITPGLPAIVTERYELAAGMTEFYRRNFDGALAHFGKSSRTDPYVLFFTGEALRMKGDSGGAAIMYRKVVETNLNSLGYAIVRPCALKERAGT